MSLRYEQQRALWDTRLLLYDILAGNVGKKADLRARAYRCLKHYPFLDSTGEPMFSQDGFPCPRLDDDPYLGYEKA